MLNSKPSNKSEFYPVEILYPVEFLYGVKFHKRIYFNGFADSDYAVLNGNSILELK